VGKAYGEDTRYCRPSPLRTSVSPYNVSANTKGSEVVNTGESNPRGEIDEALWVVTETGRGSVAGGAREEYVELKRAWK